MRSKNFPEITVNKFGGSCLGPIGEHIPIIFKQIKNQLNTGIPVLVFSAFEKVTNNLIKNGETIEKLDRVPTEKDLSILDTTFEPYLNFAKREELNDFIKRYKVIMKEGREDLKAVQRSGFDGTIKAKIKSMGERFSARLMASYLKKSSIDAFLIDFNEDFPIVTDSKPNDASVNLEASKEKVDGYIKKLIEEKRTLAIPGFIGRSKKGMLTTLPRGGTDITAIVISSLLQENFDVKTILWKDTPIRSADPKIVGASAIPIDSLSWEETELISNLGAKIVEPTAMQIARMHGLGIEIRCLFESDQVTKVYGTRATGDVVKCITGLKECVILAVRSMDSLYKIRHTLDVLGYDKIFAIDGMGLSNYREDYNIAITKNFFDSNNEILENYVEEAQDAVIVSLSGNMRNVPGVYAQSSVALKNAGINILGSTSSPRLPVILFYLEPNNYENSIQALHQEIENFNSLS